LRIPLAHRGYEQHLQDKGKRPLDSVRNGEACRSVGAQRSRRFNVRAVAFPNSDGGLKQVT